MSGFENHRRRLIPVEGHPGLYRDPSSNAIINKNTDEIEKKRAARAKFAQQQSDVEQLKSEMSEIKDLLKQLLER